LLLLPFAGSIILYSARGQPASAIVITLSEVCPFCYCRPARRNKTGGRVSSRFVSFFFFCDKKPNNNISRMPSCRIIGTAKSR
jgi:hypothetical protein